MIDILAHHPSTAKFISRKLAQRFVADDPPQALVDRMAQTFTKTDGDLRAVLETMFTSPEFLLRRRMAGQSQIAVRNGGERGARSQRRDDRYVSRWCRRSPIWASRCTTNWSPTGIPTPVRRWLSTAGVMGRMNFSAALRSGLVPGVKLDTSSLGG